MPTPTLIGNGVALNSVAVTVSASAKNVVAIVGVLRDFTGGVEPTMNGSSAGRVLLGTAGSGFGQLWWYAFTGVPAGVVTFAASGRVVGAMVYENAAILGGTLLVNNSGWSTPSPSVGPDDVCVVFNSAAWTSDVASPQYISTATGAVTLTKVQEGLSFYAAYDWGIGLYAITAASATTAYSYVPAFTNAPTINRISRVVLRYADPTVTTLTRTTLGRLAAHQASPVTGISTAFNTSDWAIAGGSLSIASGNLRITDPSVFNRIIQYITAGDLQNCYLQGVAQARVNGLDFGVLARSPNNANYIVAAASSGFAGTRVLRERVSNSNVQTQSVSANLTLPQRVSLYVDGTNAKSFWHGPAAEQSLTGIGLTTAEKAGLFKSGGDSLDWSAFFLMAGYTVVVTGVPSGHSVQVLNAADAVLASAAEVTGVSTVDLFAARVQFPDARKLRVVDGGGVIKASLTPTEGVWGGDIYALSSAPSGPPVARIVRRKFGARNLLLKR